MIHEPGKCWRCLVRKAQCYCAVCEIPVCWECVHAERGDGGAVCGACSPIIVVGREVQVMSTGHA